MDNDKLEKKFKECIKEISEQCFIKGYQPTNEEAIGMLVSKFFYYDGISALKVASYALENDNFHSENSKVVEMIKNLENK